MSVTKNIGKYVKDIGINLSELSRKSGVAYGSLYASLSEEGSFLYNSNIRNSEKEG